MWGSVTGEFAEISLLSLTKPVSELQQGKISHHYCGPCECSLAAWEILVPMAILLNRLQSPEPEQKQTAGSRCQQAEQGCYHSKSRLTVSGRAVFAVPSNTVYSAACACMHTHPATCAGEQLSQWRTQGAIKKAARLYKGRSYSTSLRSRHSFFPEWCRCMKLKDVIKVRAENTLHEKIKIATSLQAHVWQGGLWIV